MFLSQLIKTEHVKPNEKEPDKLQVITELEEDAHTPRERGFRLPKSHVQWVTYLMDKYGEDYEVRDLFKKCSFAFSYTDHSEPLNYQR